MGATLNPNQILFIGRGRSPALLHYRIQMPAEQLGCDWVGVIGNPKMLTVTTGRIAGKAFPPGIYPPDNTTLDIARYETVVIQYNQDENWVEWVRGLQAAGVRVLVETDDWLHGVRQVKGHLARKTIRGRELQRLGKLMEAADGLIVSTPYLADLTERFNTNRYVCRNGVRASRYRLAKPTAERPVTVGWAGGSGHDEALARWAPSVAQAIDRNPRSRLLTIGMHAGPLLAACGLNERVHYLPGTPTDNYPALLTHFDIGLAPAGTTDWALAKSELRWLELSALAIPSVVDPSLYVSSTDGETALWATTHDEVRDAIQVMLDDPAYATKLGLQARDHVAENYDISRMVHQWATVLNVDSTSGPSDRFTL